MTDRPTRDLFLVSWLVLFLELACIRWFPSHVMFLTFFTNIVLLACFVGMSVGCLAAGNRTRYLRGTPLWLAAAVALGLLAERFRQTLLKYLAVGDRADVDVVYFGAEAGDTLVNLPFRVPVEAVAGLFFVLIAVLLVGPGQEMGRAFTRVTSRTRAYSANLLGSLAGIATFSLCSYLQLPPVVWFAAVAAGLGYFLLRPDADETPAPKSNTQWLLFLAAAVLLTVPTSGFFTLRSRDTAWSPYYRIDFHRQTTKDGERVDELETNLVSHQVVEPRKRVPIARYANYALPYLFGRDLPEKGWPDIRRVLVIGAGSGNDLARALQWLPADAQIDAVEIDPVIQSIGKKHHPDQPYADPRINPVLNDGRNFLRGAPAETYDLVVFALVDSLVLHSGYSNLRLESYLFTTEAFRDARRVLKPNGACAVYNYFRHGWLAARIRAELREAFSADPAVFVLNEEPTASIKLDDFEPEAFTAFLAGSESVIGPLKRQFAANGNFYWVPGDRAPHPDRERYPTRWGGTAPPAALPPPDVALLPLRQAPAPWVGVRVADVAEPGGLPLATDDWPFLYVREPGIPRVTWRGIGLMVGLSALLWWVFRPRESTVAAGAAADWGLAGRSFFLGAGFMLVETKAVVQMALLFGSTWTVNSVVFAAILVMSLAGNLFAGWAKPRALWPYYAGLFAALGLGLVVKVEHFLGLPPAAQLAGACLLVFLPIAFAGVIFATTFARSSRPDRVFGANVAGALLGGLAENASVVLGFQYLLCVAGGFYALSALCGNGSRSERPA